MRVACHAEPQPCRAMFGSLRCRIAETSTHRFAGHRPAMDAPELHHRGHSPRVARAVVAIRTEVDRTGVDNLISESEAASQVKDSTFELQDVGGRRDRCAGSPRSACQASLAELTSSSCRRCLFAIKQFSNAAIHAPTLRRTTPRGRRATDKRYGFVRPWHFGASTRCACVANRTVGGCEETREQADAHAVQWGSHMPQPIRN
jgi:hypothetical protein